MKRNAPGATETPLAEETNGKNGGRHDRGLSSPELGLILTSLQTVRDGDFSVRLPGNWTGLAGKSQTLSTKSSPPTSRWRES